jgi:hypothetical protein
MTPPVGPVIPDRPGGPSRVIQGFFAGGQPRLPQPAPVVAPLPRPVPVPARPAAVQPAVLPCRPVPIQPAARPGIPAGRPGAILPGAARPGAVQPSIAAKVTAPRPILPSAPRPVVVQPSGGNAFALPPGFPLRPSGLGQRLPEAVQQKMEAFFGTSFADVRVHVGNEASTIGALAFTHGTDLYFAPGQYNPQTLQGRKLLGHELTHVVQQREGRVRNPMGPALSVVQDPALEAEAERMGLRAAMVEVASPRADGSLPPHLHPPRSGLLPGAIARAVPSAGSPRTLLPRGARGRPVLAAKAAQMYPAKAVMNPAHNFYIATDKRPGYTPPRFKKNGHHISFFPDFTEVQIGEILEDRPLGQLSQFDQIEFYEFNVTRESDRKHFFFATNGRVLWKGSNTEASPQSDGWSAAIDLAIEFLSALDVKTTRLSLFADLRNNHGRTALTAPEDHLLVKQAKEEHEKKVAAALEANKGKPIPKNFIPPSVRNKMGRASSTTGVTKSSPIAIPPRQPSVFTMPSSSPDESAMITSSPIAIPARSPSVSTPFSSSPEGMFMTTSSPIAIPQRGPTASSSFGPSGTPKHYEGKIWPDTPPSPSGDRKWEF